MRTRHSSWVWMGAGLAGLLLLVGGCKRPEAPSEPAVSEPVPEATRYEPPPGVLTALWIEDRSIIADADARAEWLAFCSEREVSMVFLNAREFPERQYDTAFMREYKSTIRLSAEAGVAVYAASPMPVSPKLIYPQGQYVAVTYLRDFLRFNREQPASEQVLGVLLTVQPQGLAKWNDEEAGLQKHFVDFAEEMRKTVIEFDEAARLGWLLPILYADYAWMPEFCERVDAIVLEDGGEGLEARTAAARKLLAQTPDAQTLVYLAHDVRDLTGVSTRRESVEQALDYLDQAMPGEVRFGGLVIQDYDHISGRADTEPAERPGEEAQ